MIAKKQFVAGLVFLCIGATFAVLSFHYPMGSVQRMGPGWFPAAVAILLALVGAVTVLKELLVPTATSGAVRIVWLPAIVICGSLALFAVAIRPLGIVPAVFILTAASTLPYRLPLWQVASLATALAAISGLLFIYLLDMPFPLFAFF